MAGRCDDFQRRRGVDIGQHADRQEAGRRGGITAGQLATPRVKGLLGEASSAAELTAGLPAPLPARQHAPPEGFLAQIALLAGHNGTLPRMPIKLPGVSRMWLAVRLRRTLPVAGPRR